MSSTIASKATWRLPPVAVYPQRPETGENWLTRVENVVAGLPVLMLPRLRRLRLSRIVRSVNELTTVFARLDDQELRAEVQGRAVKPAVIVGEYPEGGYLIGEVVGICCVVGGGYSYEDDESSAYRPDRFVFDRYRRPRDPLD